MATGAPPSAFGYIGKQADLNRFARRYRFARSLHSIKLDTYHPDTEAGYTALLRAFLMWGAFESYLRLLGLKQNMSDAFLVSHNPGSLDAQVRSFKSTIAFYEFLVQFLKTENKTQITEFVAGRPYNASYLASSIRHVFAHGTLTANPGGVDSVDLVPIVDAVTNWHFTVLDTDFAGRFP